MRIRKNVDVKVEIDFGEVKDEFECEILDMISDELFYAKKKEVLERALRGSEVIVAMAINTIAQSESKFNELFYALSDEAKERFKELFAYYERAEK